MNPYHPPGDLSFAPWDEPFLRYETIEVCECKDCGCAIDDGDECAQCHAVNTGMCCSCYKEPVQNKDSDICAGCAADAATRYQD